MSTQIADATALVNFVKDFTGSTNDAEIKKCIYLAELMMRNIELPALRTDPYTTIGIADEDGYVPIPADMNKPIVFFNQGNPGTQTGPNEMAGPWIVYDRIGDRDIITQEMIQNLYLTPINIPQVYRGKFGEVGQRYEFLPALGAGAEINLYYYKTWPFLFADAEDQVISATGTVGSIAGTGPWTASITGMTGTSGLTIGDEIFAIDGTGSISNGGTVIVTSVGSTSITVAVTGGTIPTAGNITDITLTNQEIQTNAVLQSWSEGYVYGTLHNYYAKRKNNEEATYWRAKFDDAWNTVEDQNNKGKWSGGHTRLTSIFQPRRDQRYTTR